ncbi:hypothetical protein, partial [Alistipes putredinis]|uniref:hypothetical protein n=1 Tax=Alistipes putredinis TaxID=28117 RepID=UPI002FE1F4A9
AQPFICHFTNFLIQPTGNMYFFRGMVAGRFRLAGYEVMDENYDFPLIPPYPFYYSLFVAVYFYRAALAEQNRFVG